MDDSAMWRSAVARCLKWRATGSPELAGFDGRPTARIEAAAAPRSRAEDLVPM